MTPGPSFAKKRFSQFDSERSFDIKLLFQREPALVERNVWRANCRQGSLTQPAQVAASSPDQFQSERLIFRAG
jgi:hypothetical protein